MIIIGVIGASCDDEGLNKAAYEVGALVAKKGAVLVCGGLGGVMENACRGAKESGGLTVGILPSNDKNDANRWVDVPIVTGMGYARNVLIVKTADAVISIGGKFGTLSEIGHTLNVGKKVFALRGWEMLKPLEGFEIVESPEEAVEKAYENALMYTNVR